MFKRKAKYNETKYVIKEFGITTKIQKRLKEIIKKENKSKEMDFQEARFGEDKRMTMS